MSLWGEIADTIVRQIDTGALSPGERLPSDADLAVQFNVNRHTVRRAIAHLADEGLIRSERGRGSFVVESALSYRLGARTKFEENLLDQSKTPSRQLLGAVEIVAPELVGQALGLANHERVLMATMIGEADGVPIHIFKAYFPLRRFPDAKKVLERLEASFPAGMTLVELLEALGVRDFRRLTARVRARVPTTSEANQLKMPRSGAVLELEVLNVDGSGEPVFFGSTCMCGSRIEFLLDL